MRKVRFIQADVFSDSPFGGNPVVVVPDADGMTSDEMQALARGMSFAETAFITTPTIDGAAFAVRCFSPTTELAYSGHQVLGAGYVMVAEARVDLIAGRAELPVQVGKELCHVAVNRDAARDVTRVTATERPATFLGVVEDREAVAAALSVDTDAIRVDAWPVERVRMDLTCLMVPVRDLATMRLLLPAKGALDALLSSYGAALALAFSKDTLSPMNDVHVRVFAPPLGIDEDPATGSANAALAAYLHRHGALTGDGGLGRRTAGGLISLRSEQGSEMGRPSVIELELDPATQPPVVRVGGRVQRSVEGSVYY